METGSQVSITTDFQEKGQDGFDLSFYISLETDEGLPIRCSNFSVPKKRKRKKISVFLGYMLRLQVFSPPPPFDFNWSFVLFYKHFGKKSTANTERRKSSFLPAFLNAKEKKKFIFPSEVILK